MSKHTPGPWEHNDYQIIAGETVIANCTYGDRNSNNANDARLIAAAPELLEALQYAIKQVPELATVPGIAAAIAKTTGEQA